jgi:hypothetical protein
LALEVAGDYPRETPLLRGIQPWFSQCGLAIMAAIFSCLSHIEECMQCPRGAEERPGEILTYEIPPIRMKIVLPISLHSKPYENFTFTLN